MSIVGQVLVLGVVWEYLGTSMNIWGCLKGCGSSCVIFRDIFLAAFGCLGEYMRAQSWRVRLNVVQYLFSLAPF